MAFGLIFLAVAAVAQLSAAVPAPEYRASVAIYVETLKITKLAAMKRAIDGVFDLAIDQSTDLDGSVINSDLKEAVRLTTYAIAAIHDFDDATVETALSDLLPYIDAAVGQILAAKALSTSTSTDSEIKTTVTSIKAGVDAALDELEVKFFALIMNKYSKPEKVVTTIDADQEKATLYVQKGFDAMFDAIELFVTSYASAPESTLASIEEYRASSHSDLKTEGVTIFQAIQKSAFLKA